MITPIHICDSNMICAMFFTNILHIFSASREVLWRQQCCPEISFEVKRHREAFWGQLALILCVNSFHLWLFCSYVNVNWMEIQFFKMKAEIEPFCLLQLTRSKLFIFYISTARCFWFDQIAFFYGKLFHSFFSNCSLFYEYCKNTEKLQYMKSLLSLTLF